MEILLQQIINGLVLGSMYALVALGYTMVYGIINLINFAHGEVLMVGALTSWTIIGIMKDAMPTAPGWLILVIALLISCTVAAALNFVIEKVAYRPLRNSPKLAPLITAIGMSILLQTLAMIIWKPNYKPYPTLLPSAPIDVAGAVITPTQIMILGLTAVSLALLMWLVNYTKLGRAMRATAENPRVAALMGVKPDMVIFGHLHHWCHPGGHCGCDVRIELRHGAAHHGFPAWLEGVYRRSVWRHRQPGGCGGGWYFARADRVHRRGLYRHAHRGLAGQPLHRHFCLCGADHCSHVASIRPAR